MARSLCGPPKVSLAAARCSVEYLGLILLPRGHRSCKRGHFVGTPGGRRFVIQEEDHGQRRHDRGRDTRASR
jgi:hypothetical protein